MGGCHLESSAIAAPPGVTDLFQSHPGHRSAGSAVQGWPSPLLLPRGVPRSPGPHRGSLPRGTLTPSPCPWLTIRLPAGADTDLLFQCHRGGRGASHSVGPPLPRPFLLDDQRWARSALSPSLSALPRLPSRTGLPSFPEGLCSASSSILFPYVVSARRQRPLFPTLLSSLIPACLALPQAFPSL